VPNTQRNENAERVGQAAAQYASEGKSDHGRRIGQRGAAAVDTEFGFDCRQGDDDRPQADAAEGADRQRYHKPPPRVATVDGVSIRFC